MEVKISSGYDRNKLEKLIGEIVKEKLAAEGIMNGIKEQKEVIDEFRDNNIAQMLGNLELFK